MKYAIKDTYYWFDTKDYIDHKDSGWVQGINTARFKDKNKTPMAHHTKILSEAKLYNNPIEAAAVAKIISTPTCTAVVVEVTDKEIFEARLKNK